MKPIRNIILLPNTTKDISGAMLKAITSAWERGGCRISVLPESVPYFAGRLPGKTFPVLTAAELDLQDAVCVLGGDGSILAASHRFLGHSIPMFGINFGHLGYLTTLEAGEIAEIPTIAAGAYVLESRMMLQIEALREDGASVWHATALNDAVLTNGPIARLLRFSVFCNGIPMQDCRADGVIVATPTGSTAYSMSAGGPILSPELDCVCITPICPHALGNRPILLPGASVVEIRNIQSKNSSVYLTTDGRDGMTLPPHTIVRITRSAYTTQLIRFRNDGFFRTLQKKMTPNGANL